MMLLSVYEGRRKGGNWGMGSHIDRINIFLLFIGAAFFMPAVDGHRYDSVSIPQAQSCRQAVTSAPAPAFSINQVPSVEKTGSLPLANLFYVSSKYYETRLPPPPPPIDEPPPLPPPTPPIDEPPPPPPQIDEPPPLPPPPPQIDEPPPPPPPPAPIDEPPPLPRPTPPIDEPPPPPPQIDEPPPLPPQIDELPPPPPENYYPPSPLADNYSASNYPPLPPTSSSTGKKKKAIVIIIVVIVIAVIVVVIGGGVFVWRYRLKRENADVKQSGASTHSASMQQNQQTPSDNRVLLPGLSPPASSPKNTSRAEATFAV